MEKQSIFQSDISQTSNDSILSASKWSRFLGILFIICAGLIALAVLGVSLVSQSDAFTEAFEKVSRTNPQFAVLKDMPMALFSALIFIAVAFTVFLGVLLINIGRHGIAYASSNDDLAFVNTFKAAKTYFLVYAIISIIGILFSIIGLF